MHKCHQWAAVTGLVAVLALTLSACGERQVAPPVAQDTVATETLQLQTIAEERWVDGTIEAINQATVSAQTSGRITDIYFDVNDFVPAGALIMRLRSTQQRAGLAQASAVVQAAETRMHEAQAQFSRVNGLYQDKVATKAELDAALANRDAASAALASARAALDAASEGVAYTEVRAPYAGIVTKRLVQVGETVQPGSPLMSGVSLQYLRVNFALPQSVVEKVRSTRQAAILINGKRIDATHFTIFPEADSATHTFHARANLPANATDLHPGMFVKVALVMGSKQVLMVPASSLVTRSEVTAVYVRNADKQLRLRQVRLGRTHDDRVEIVAGLSVGDQVVLDPLAAAQWLQHSQT